MRRLRFPTGRHRSPSTNTTLGLLLAFNAGAVNAGGFLVLHMYTSHMTGFASQVADGLVLGNLTLLLNALKGRWKQGFEIWSLGIATLLAVLFAYYSCRLAWQSYTFHDISTGNDATPLWIPQLSMAWGTVVLAIAFLDELVLELRGQRRVPAPPERITETRCIYWRDIHGLIATILSLES